MPQLQSLVLTDRATTPVNHTFVPQNIRDGVGIVVKTDGVPIGEKKLTVSMRKAGNRYRGKIVLSLPTVVTETINGVSSPMVARVAYATLDVVYDEKSTKQERDDLIGMLASALDPAKTLVDGCLVELEGVY